MNAINSQKSETKVIDVTPSWESILNLLLLAYTRGDAKGRTVAHEELVRLAQIADRAVAQSKTPQGEQIAKLRAALKSISTLASCCPHDQPDVCSAELLKIMNLARGALRD